MLIHLQGVDHAYAAKPLDSPESVDPLKQLLAKFTTFINRLSSAEVILPDDEMQVLLRCPVKGCAGALVIRSNHELEKMRKRSAMNAEEPSILLCSQCRATFTISSRLSAALDHGFHRCFGRARLTDEEIIDIKWSGMPSKPAEDDVPQFERWQLLLASVQLQVNLHDWKHRSSCFKTKSNQCRYHLPQNPVDATSVLPLLATKKKESTTAEAEVTGVQICLRRRPPFALVTECNIPFLTVLNYNNCTRYVVDQKVSMYLSSYVSKHSTENERELAEVLRLLHIYIDKIALQQAQSAQITSQVHF